MYKTCSITVTLTDSCNDVKASEDSDPGMKTALPAAISDKLDMLLAECNDWHLLDDLSSLPRRIWITYSMHYGMGQVDKWVEIIEEQIGTGIKLLKMSEEILDGEDVNMLNGEGCRELWRELQQATREIHWILATLQVRLDQVRSGRVLQHPDSVCPYN